LRSFLRLLKSLVALENNRKFREEFEKTWGLEVITIIIEVTKSNYYKSIRIIEVIPIIEVTIWFSISLWRDEPRDIV